MAVLIRVIETALPVLAALLLGMFCREKAFLSREGVDALKKVVINITLPAVLVDAFATAQYSLSSLTIPVTVFLLCGLGLAVGFLLARLMKLGRLPAFLATGFEAGMLGYALFALLYPEEPASTFAILDLGQSLFVFTVYKGLLAGSGNRKAVIRDIVTSPIIWAIAVGVILGATGIYSAMASIGVSGILDGLTGFISAPTGMIILLAVGYDLDLKAIQWKQTGRFILLRLATMAILLAVLLTVDRLVLGHAIHTGAAILLCLLPPPYVLPIFSTDESQRTALSSAISALTLVTMILFAVMAVVV